MTGFIESRPDLVVPNPGGLADPLGESAIDPTQSWLRVFEPRDVRLVVGRHQDPARELIAANAQADGIPVHRRISGGGAVVLAPGMVVVALRLRNDEFGTACHLDRVNSALVPAVTAVCGAAPRCRGHGDLVMVGDDGAERKVLGASLRQTSRLVLYLGVFLVDDAVPLMERYLAPPSREPDYRQGRGHGAFCTGLARHGASVQALTVAVAAHAERILGDQALR